MGRKKNYKAPAGRGRVCWSNRLGERTERIHQHQDRQPEVKAGLGATPAQINHLERMTARFPERVRKLFTRELGPGLTRARVGELIAMAKRLTRADRAALGDCDPRWQQHVPKDDSHDD